ncbi:MAG: hypothetical protein V4558_12950 [Gemmatimonadota bacterium]
MRETRFLLAGAVLISGCATAMPGPVIPVALQPVTAAQVQGWVQSTKVTERRLIRFGWQFHNPREGTVGGKGSVQIAVPDSLRFDYRGTLGMGRGAAVVIGDSAHWAQPEDQFKKLVPNYSLLWAMLGVARDPKSGDQLAGLDNETITAWRYVDGADTVEYARTKLAPMQLVADVREGGKRIGRVVTTFNEQGQPVKSQLDVPAGQARLTLKFTLFSTPKPFDPEIWHAPIDN